MYGTIYYYHTIVCSLVNITATVFALLFNLGPLSVLRANNRKNLMPIIPDLSNYMFNFIMSMTSFEKSKIFQLGRVVLLSLDRAIIHIRFIRYRLKIGRKAFNTLMLKQHKQSLILYVRIEIFRSHIQ